MEQHIDRDIAMARMPLAYLAECSNDTRLERRADRGIPASKKLWFRYRGIRLFIPGPMFDASAVKVIGRIAGVEAGSIHHYILIGK
jgi:hypothetical protein